MKSERKVRKERTASSVTSKGFADPLGRRDPLEKLVSLDNQEPRVTGVCPAGTVWKACLALRDFRD